MRKFLEFNKRIGPKKGICEILKSDNSSIGHQKSSEVFSFSSNYLYPIGQLGQRLLKIV